VAAGLLDLRDRGDQQGTCGEVACLIQGLRTPKEHPPVSDAGGGRKLGIGNQLGHTLNYSDPCATSQCPGGIFAANPDGCRTVLPGKEFS
jgi:hypothetical protein